MGHGNQRPEIELVRAFMPVLVTSKFDDDSIKINELAWRHLFPIISIWEFLDLKAANNKGADQTTQMHRLICAFVVRIWYKQVFS